MSNNAFSNGFNGCLGVMAAIVIVWLIVVFGFMALVLVGLLT